MSFYSAYRWCIVADCKSTIFKTPNKLFIKVPHDINMRNVWLKLAGRDPAKLSNKSVLYLCENHFDLEKDMENYMKFKIMGKVKRIQMKPNVIPTKFNHSKQIVVPSQTAKSEESTSTSVDPNPSTSDETDLVLNKPAKVYKKPGIETETGTIRVFELGLCKECGQHIKRFQWWCLHCSGARCYECAQDKAHDTHLILRTAAGGSDEKTRAVIENIQKQLQIETVQIKSEIEDEDTGNDQSESNDRLNVEEEPEIKVEPTSSEFDPLSVKPDPDAPYFENPTKSSGLTRSKRSLDYQPENPDDRQVLDYNFDGVDLPSSQDVMDMEDIDGHFEPQNKRSRSQQPPHNEQNFTVTTNQNDDHDYTIRIHSIHSQRDTNTVKQNNDFNRKQKSNIQVSSCSQESYQNTSLKQKNNPNRIQQSNIRVFRVSGESHQNITTKQKNDQRQSKIKILSQSELNERKRVYVKPKNDHNKELQSNIQVLRRCEGSNQSMSSAKQKNDDNRIQQANIQEISHSEKVKSNQGGQLRKTQLPKIQVYTSHSELETGSNKQNVTRRSNSEHQNTTFSKQEDISSKEQSKIRIYSSHSELTESIKKEK